MVKCRFQAIKLYVNKHIVLFTKKIFENSLGQETRLSICFKTRSYVFQTFVRLAFEVLRENRKLDREFEKFGQVFKKLGHVLAL